VIVLGDLLFAGVPPALRPWLLPLAAFVGAMAVTLFVFAVARAGHGVSIATLILAGVAVNAIAGAGIGALVYVSDDDQRATSPSGRWARSAAPTGRWR
jgi:iron complex transport system permease protein